MEQTNIDQILGGLADELKAISAANKVTAPGEILAVIEQNLASLFKNVPYGSLSGDHIEGGKIKNFSSSGIRDSATKTVLTIDDTGIKTRNASIDTVDSNLNVSKTLTANELVVVNDLTVSGILRANLEVDYKKILNQIPQRAFTGDMIAGGTIRNFASTGIRDVATSPKIVVQDDAVAIEALKTPLIKGDVTVENSLTVKDARITGTLTAEVITVKELRTDIRIERSTPLEFVETADSPIIGKGLVWKSGKSPKQLILKDQETIWSSQNIDLAQERSYMIDSVSVLSVKELGPTVSKSRLKEVGNLNKLTVLGDVNFNDVFVYNSVSDRIGIGIEQGHSKLSVFEHNVEIMLGTKDQSKAVIGTFASNELHLVTDDTSRIVIDGSGNTTVGDANSPKQVKIFGKVSIGIKNPDPSVSLHVDGPIRIADRLQSYGSTAPIYGTYKKGDIVWNSEPAINQPIGWVCVADGSPGIWAKFGMIG